MFKILEWMFGVFLIGALLLCCVPICLIVYIFTILRNKKVDNV